MTNTSVETGHSDPRAAGADMTAQDILAQLVAFPTISSESNLPLIGWIEAYLAGWGIAARRVPSPDGAKANLYAVIGPQTAGGVALSGHTDVVPVEGQDWTSDPFVLTERDGRLYGRGATDMKGFLALMLAIVPTAARAALKRPLYLAFSYDEEVGCEGCASMIEEMTQTLPAPAVAIVGEPSGLQVIEGHKGSIAWNVRVKGRSVHSSLMHTGVSAVMEAARLIQWANEVNAANRAATPGPLAAPFDPPWTTTHVGVISGGVANNITAADCRFTFDFRVVPGETLEDWEARFHEQVAKVRAGMQAVAPEADIFLEPMFRVPPLAPEPDGRAAALVGRLAQRNDRGVVSFGAEAGRFQLMGWPTVICGPGDIARAHKADEYIAVGEMEDGMSFMRRLVDWLATPEDS